MKPYNPPNNLPKKPEPDVLTTPSAPGRLDMTTVYRELKNSLMRFAYRYYKKPQDIEGVSRRQDKAIRLTCPMP
ncbi:hypothetical protein N9537_07650 [Porticoccaceae bacterium]|nr:hypothetical protein [Porticoccaceae bacterium]